MSRHSSTVHIENPPPRCTDTGKSQAQVTRKPLSLIPKSRLNSKSSSPDHQDDQTAPIKHKSCITAPMLSPQQPLGTQDFAPSCFRPQEPFHSPSFSMEPYLMGGTPGTDRSGVYGEDQDAIPVYLPPCDASPPALANKKPCPGISPDTLSQVCTPQLAHPQATSKRYTSHPQSIVASCPSPLVANNCLNTPPRLFRHPIPSGESWLTTPPASTSQPYLHRPSIKPSKLPVRPRQTFVNPAFPSTPSHLSLPGTCEDTSKSTSEGCQHVYSVADPAPCSAASESILTTTPQLITPRARETSTKPRLNSIITFSSTTCDTHSSDGGAAHTLTYSAVSSVDLLVKDAPQRMQYVRSGAQSSTHVGDSITSLDYSWSTGTMPCGKVDSSDTRPDVMKGINSPKSGSQSRSEDTTIHGRRDGCVSELQRWQEMFLIEELRHLKKCSGTVGPPRSRVSRARHEQHWVKGMPRRPGVWY